MNRKLVKYAIADIKEGLLKLKEGQVLKFKRIFATSEVLKKCVNGAVYEYLKTVNVDEIIDSIPEDELTTAMDLIERTIKKDLENGENKHEINRRQ